MSYFKSTIIKDAAGAEVDVVVDALKVDGSAVTQPVSGTVTSTPAVTGGGTEVGAQRVTIANDSTGVISVDDNGLSLSVDDGGNILTVDGIVTEPNSAAILADTTAIKTAVETIDNAIAGSEMQVDIVTSALPTGAATEATLAAILADTANIETAVQLIDDAVSGSGFNITQVGGTNIDTNSGNKSAGTQRMVIATDQPQLTTPLNTAVKAEATGGCDKFYLVSAGTTNATNIKASAGKVMGWYIYNSNAAARKVMFHNTAGSPTAGASTYFPLVIPPSSGANMAFGEGIAFSTGIAITTVTDLTDAGNTAVAANDLIITIFYK